MHDTKSVKTLINEYPCKRILTNQGYLSKPLKQELARYGIWFWTPRRSNMTPYRYNDQLLKRRHRSIKTVFSKLEALFNIEHNNAKSLKGFNAKLKQCLLVDTIKNLTSTIRNQYYSCLKYTSNKLIKQMHEQISTLM